MATSGPGRVGRPRTRCPLCTEPFGTRPTVDARGTVGVVHVACFNLWDRESEFAECGMLRFTDPTFEREAA